MTEAADIAGGDNAQKVAAAELRSFCERIERLEEEKANISSDIKDVRAEAKGRGYDLKVLAEMLKLRKMDKDERDNREALRTLYGEALGVFS